MSRRVRDEAGFTLVEVMVAVLILGLVLVAACYGMNATLAGIRLGEDVAVAVGLLRQVAEETKLIPFADLADAAWDDYGGKGYDLEREVAVVLTHPDNPAVAEIKQVQLHAYRRPRSRHPAPIASWTFLVYRGGI
ncbi:MAG: prepilin-type N-terminal cleavage/methylation domain-containing protein [bacterium]|nr:prepilin-type N-terminal cleavage/methylation domain-containing protein [bacterium]